ncbi:uncharacterized protein LOC119964797 isoform X2 [Scyliorhinus canicula]|uniref:uncharacterized protein LOC119964797 isoform X2 n=1 Tax=Scyliorhinus canicula TaxID=7830 RepID=UPI0018F40C45|nr:uncharacterized protein LOC119964797 isoform X2 [Scyliorhinus canicula]
MEHFEAEINLDVTSEMDTDYNGDLLEKMDDYQFARFVENHCINLQQSLNILDEDCIKQSPDNSLIWEKSFEHSILLDVDDDFNLNFSDVCDSYTIFLSQSSAEDDSLNIIADDIGKIENGYDGSDEDEIQTTEETGYEHNQDIHCSSYSDKPDETKDNLESSFQEDKLQEMAGNTTDEEQEELPFDGNLQNVSEYPTDKNLDLVDHMPTRLVSNQSDHMPVSRMIQTQSFRDKRSTVENSFFQEKVPDSELSTGTEASNHRSENEPNTFLSEDTAGVLVAEHEAKLCSTNELFFNPLNDGRSSIAESLLRYFSEEDLALSSTMYIDSETLPETSFTDSFEETVIKKHIPSVATNDLLINIKEFTMSETDRSRKQELDSIFANEEKMLHDENDSHYRTAQGIMESNYVKGLENSPKITQEQNTETPLSIETILEITQNPMLKMGRTISYNEIKYGRVKQHYTLPDLSKVEPKVKIPKRNASNSYNSNKTIMKKAKPSAGSPESSQAIHKSAADVVGEMLDSTQSSVILARTEVNNEKQEKQSVEANHTPELFQQLQEEFDKLLIKYAEAENTIDQLRFGAKVSAYSDSNKNQMAQSETLSPRCQINNLTGPQQHHAQSGSTSDSAILFSLDSCQSIAEVYKATEGERMAQELNKHIEYFKHQVEDFLKCLNTRSISVEDAQWEFKKLIDGQDKLERSYIANKDEHRSLQQRRYLDKNITAGEFDPDREIEGQIFRIGMQLENIKEKIDDDICNRSSPNNSIIMSSPLSTRESTMDAIIQEGLRIGLVTQDSFQMDVVSEELPEEDIKDTQIEDRYNCIPQKQIPTVSTKTPSTLLENNLHSAANPSDSFMNETLGLRSTSFQRQESLIEFKQQQHSPDNGNTGSEGCKPTTVIKTLDSEQSQTERYSSFCESIPSFKTELNNANRESSSFLTSEHIIEKDNEKDNNKVRQLLQLADPSSCISPFNWHKTTFGVEDSAAASGNAFPALDLLIESSDDHIPLPIPQQCKPKTFLQQAGENDNLSRRWSTKNEEILELQDEVSNLKQKLEESLSKLSYEPPSQEQRYRTKSCHRKKTSSTSKSVEDVKLTTSTLNSLKRRHCTWLRADVDVSDRELNLYSSTNGLNLHAWRMNSCVLCSKDAPHKISERSPGRRHGLTSNNGISAAAVNKCTEMLASISPLRYDAIEYPLISSASRIYYSPTYEIDKIESPCLPNQFYRTKSFLRSKVNKSTCNPQISHLSTSLDKAIEAANSMKKTTRRMIKILSADLTKAEYYKYLYDF